MPRVEQVLPKYLQIANAIRDQVLRGELVAGDEVPSERQLASDWHVARPTATKALSELRRLGLIESRRGTGSFVRGVGLARRAEDRYRHAQETGGVYAADEEARILSAGLVEPPEHVSSALGLGEKALAIRRERVTSDRQGSRELSVSWFSGTLAAVAPRLLVMERIREGSTAYAERVTGRVVLAAQDRLCARSATRAEAEALAVPRTSAVLVTEHRVLDRDGEVLEFVEAVRPPGTWTPTREFLLRP